MLYQKASFRAERANPLSLEKVFTPDNNTQQDIQVIMSTLLIRVRDCNYSNDIFPENCRERDDFESLVQSSWIEAITHCPPLYFAATEDIQLKAREQLLRKSTANINAWVSKIERRPSILERKNHVPKSIRIHPKLLDAYVTGWLRRLEHCPYRFWYRYGNRWNGGRVYMSSATCYSSRFFNGMVENCSQGNNIRSYESHLLE